MGLLHYKLCFNSFFFQLIDRNFSVYDHIPFNLNGRLMKERIRQVNVADFDNSSTGNEQIFVFIFIRKRYMYIKQNPMYFYRVLEYVLKSKVYTCTHVARHLALRSLLAPPLHPSRRGENTLEGAAWGRGRLPLRRSARRLLMALGDSQGG